MRVHYLQHVPYGGLGSMRDALSKRGCTLTPHHLYKGDKLPTDDAFDWLIVMGGPMGVYDELAYPWLKEEKACIRRAIKNGKTVLGICLGAQLIAAALGATVHAGGVKEIGWHEVKPTEQAEHTVLRAIFSTPAMVFHWHGDTFDLPKGAIPLASSDACDNQAFILGERVVGLQFHMETTIISASALINNSAEELVSGRYVQSAEEMMAITNRFTHIGMKMDSLIDRMHRQTVAQMTLAQ